MTKRQSVKGRYFEHFEHLGLN